MKAVAVNASLQILFEAAVCFDLDLPEYRYDAFNAIMLFKFKFELSVNLSKGQTEE